MNKFALAVALAAITTTPVLADTYTVTVTNTLAEELLAPIVVTGAANDSHFFEGDYVTPAAEEQVLTGDPGMVVASIGEGNAAVGHGMAGPPGVLLPAGESITFDVETDATSLRIFAMVAPTMVPDNYVSNVVDVHGVDETTVMLSRFDIGHDEGTMSTMQISEGAASVTISRHGAM
ncbi:MAG: hypothetical protein AB8B88_12835 [Devosiaceae bacterium]